jgi:Rrf2 family cysteine metabolism transcriptional repressor
VKVSAKAEYACVAMVELASRYRQGQPVQIKTIADVHGISARFLVQILLQLKGAGMVASSRGASGGYQLARSPDSITLAEIINSIDRSPEVPTVLNELPQSSVVRSLHEVWRQVNAAEQRLLEKTNLADLVQQSQEQDMPSYQI